MPRLPSAAAAAGAFTVFFTTFFTVVQLDGVARRRLPLVVGGLHALRRRGPRGAPPRGGRDRGEALTSQRTSGFPYIPYTQLPRDPSRSSAFEKAGKPLSVDGVLSTRKRLAALALAAVAVTAAGPARAAPVQLVINNGLAPPNPENVIDADYDPFLFDVFVRNVGCGDESPEAPCPLSGPPTTVALVEGGMVNSRLEVYDTSTLEMTGGSALLLRARGSSTLLIRGGTITNTLDVGDSASAWFTGGSVDQFLYLFDAGSVALSGGTVARVLPSGVSRLVLTGGTVQDHVAASASGRILVRSGAIGTFLAGFDAATVLLRGGRRPASSATRRS